MNGTGYGAQRNGGMNGSVHGIGRMDNDGPIGNPYMTPEDSRANDAYYRRMQKRTDKVACTIGSKGPSGLRPFWDFNQDSLDEPTVRWQAETDLNGNLKTLYIQAPYGYHEDMMTAPKSMVLGNIAKQMESNGHPNWAGAVRNDMVSEVSWVSGNCQTVGISYAPNAKVDRTFLLALSNWDPYNIQVLHPELMNKLADDEKATDAVRMDWNWLPMTAMIVGYTIAATYGFLALLNPATALVPAIGGLLCGVAGSLAVSNKEFMKTLKKESRSLGDRPGYVLKTTSGWVVMLFDASTHATPEQLTAKAIEELNEHLQATNDVDKDAVIVSKFTNKQGNMVFLQSQHPLHAECELSPYDAQEYLSLYAKHQKPILADRRYKANGPTVINTTASLPEVQYQPSTNESTATGDNGAWTPQNAMLRAADRANQRVQESGNAAEEMNGRYMKMFESFTSDTGEPSSSQPAHIPQHMYASLNGKARELNGHISEALARLKSLDVPVSESAELLDTLGTAAQYTSGLDIGTIDNPTTAEVVQGNLAMYEEKTRAVMDRLDAIERNAEKAKLDRLMDDVTNSTGTLGSESTVPVLSPMPAPAAVPSAHKASTGGVSGMGEGNGNGSINGHAVNPFRDPVNSDDTTVSDKGAQPLHDTVPASTSAGSNGVTADGDGDSMSSLIDSITDDLNDENGL